MTSYLKNISPELVFGVEPYWDAFVSVRFFERITGKIVSSFQNF
jgi:hypothetical protein